MAESKPVIVIVPGGFCSPEVYQPVADILEQDGFTVIIPRLTVTKNLTSKDPASPEFKELANKGLVDDVKEIHERLASEFGKGSEVVIFGHSYGSLPGLLAIEGHTVEERQAKGLSGGIKGYVAVAGFAYAQRGKNARGDTEPAPPMPYFEHEDGIFHMTEAAKPLFFSDLSPTNKMKLGNLS
ncbi:Alpha/beta hydrolase fold-1 [Fusarium oxysporum f. sp. vasinfectum]|nr:Alpha/beta hydrolase fold-1 [Fusarium oxysporum f. sp. vasinfectum]KAK2935259.1 Alpha/beta hydrolase fold-1 [Fusarium oxysporum f. sp. vasinfectum]